MTAKTSGACPSALHDTIIPPKSAVFLQGLPLPDEWSLPVVVPVQDYVFFHQRPDLGLVVADVLTLCAYDVRVSQGLRVVCQAFVFPDCPL